MPNSVILCMDYIYLMLNFYSILSDCLIGFGDSNILCWAGLHFRVSTFRAPLAAFYAFLCNLLSCYFWFTAFMLFASCFCAFLRCSIPFLHHLGTFFTKPYLWFGIYLWLFALSSPIKQIEAIGLSFLMFKANSAWCFVEFAAFVSRNAFVVLESLVVIYCHNHFQSENSFFG